MLICYDIPIKRSAIARLAIIVLVGPRNFVEILKQTGEDINLDVGERFQEYRNVVKIEALVWNFPHWDRIGLDTKVA